MATIRFSNAIGSGADMGYNDFFYGWQAAATPQTIRYIDGVYAITYGGRFVFERLDVHGRLDSISESRNGVTIYIATGLGKDANVVWRHALAGDDAGALRYLTSGHDAITGTRYGDVLRGNAGNDRIDGAAGADRLFGGGGSDRLAGGAGHDILRGEAGADTFVFRAAAESPRGVQRDQIRDFSRAADDHVDLSGFDANPARAGVQDFAFIGARAFFGKAGELKFAGGVLAADRDGDRVADFEVALAGVASMAGTDFIL
jgi:Ca2+-binding RTX toxin-like protein